MNKLNFANANVIDSIFEKIDFNDLPDSINFFVFYENMDKNKIPEPIKEIDKIIKTNMDIETRETYYYSIFLETIMEDYFININNLNELEIQKQILNCLNDLNSLEKIKKIYIKTMYKAYAMFLKDEVLNKTKEQLGDNFIKYINNFHSIYDFPKEYHIPKTIF